LIFGKQRLEQIFAEWGGDFKAGAGVTSFGWGCHNLEFQFFNRDSFGCMVCVRVYSHPCLNDRQAVCESAAQTRSSSFCFRGRGSVETHFTLNLWRDLQQDSKCLNL